MSDQADERGSKEAEIEREIREARKFTPTEAIARLAGPGAMKGASPVSRLQQAETEIGTWLRSHVTDTSGALQLLLHRHLRESRLLLENLDRPLVALGAYCRDVLASELRLKDLVRETDVEWGRSMGERPYFETEGSPPRSGDPYTIESVRRTLGEILVQLAEPASSTSRGGSSGESR
jgi:hypothetical protein